MFHRCDTRSHTNLGWLIERWAFHHMPITANYTACNVNITQGRPGRQFCCRVKLLTAGPPACSVTGGVANLTFNHWTLISVFVGLNPATDNNMSDLLRPVFM